MKKRNKKSIYLSVWAVYMTFSFLLFPHLNVSVMLFSIPLTMLGGWFYSYKGALFTTCLTIPAHFIMLNIYSDDPAMLREALNPFGIGSQLVFSCCTALLKSSQDRYNKLNSSLGQLVDERTKDLKELTEYLIDARNFETRELNASLLEKPYGELKSMLATSSLLTQQLKDEGHPRSGDVENIHGIIRSCIQQLKTMDTASIPTVMIQDSIHNCIRDLINQVEQFSDSTLTYPSESAWKMIKPEITTPLCEIIYEAVGNALRHADPDHINIGISENTDRYIVYIENDGIPIKPNPLEGMGLPLMRYRTAKMDAVFSIKSLPDKRTRVECTILKDL